MMSTMAIAMVINLLNRGSPLTALAKDSFTRVDDLRMFEYSDEYMQFANLHIFPNIGLYG